MSKERDRQGLSSIDREKVDSLCRLWRNVLKYHRALQDRVNAWRGDLSDVLDVFPIREAQRFYNTADREKCLAQSDKDLLDFETDLLRHTGRKEPPWWICDWHGGDCLPTMRSTVLYATNSVNNAWHLRKRLVSKAVSEIEILLEEKRVPDERTGAWFTNIDIYARNYSATNRLSYAEFVTTIKASLKSIKVKHLLSKSTAGMTKTEIKAGKNGRLQMAARIVVGNVLGVSETTIRDWTEGRHGGQTK